MRELKQHADSLHTSSVANAMEEGQLWYMAGMSRPRENFTPEDWELLAAMYSNYAGTLIFGHDNSVLAFPYLLEAMRIEREKCPDDFALCSAYVSMGRIYLNYGNVPRAVNILREGLDRNLRSRSPERANYAFANMLSELWGIGALDSISDVVDEWARRPVDNSPASHYCNMQAKAAVALREHDYADAVAFLRESLFNMNVEYGKAPYYVTTYLMLLDVYLRVGDFTKALEYIRLTENLKNQSGDFYTDNWRNNLVESYYRQTGQEALADSVNMINLRLKDSLYNARNHTLIS